jgi:hypothetical protein
MQVLNLQARPQLGPALHLAQQRLASAIGAGVEVLALPLAALDSWAERAHVDMVILDMASLPGAQILHAAERVLEQCPFTRVVIVAVPLNGGDDPEVLFTLGAVGAWKVVSGADALRPEWWVETWSAALDAHVSRDFRRLVEQRLPDTLGAGVVARLAEHAHVPTVSGVADRMIRVPGLTLASKRRRLWELCQQYGLPAPESVHDALRLRLLKELCQREWPPPRAAVFMGYQTPRNMARSVKQRYGVTLAQVKALAPGEPGWHVLPELWDAA